MNYEITFNCTKNQHGQSQKMHLFSSMMKLCRNNEFVLFSMQRIIKMWELWEGCHSELYQKIFLVIYNNIIKAFPFVLLFCPKHGVVLFYFLIIIEDDNVQNASLCNAQKFIGEGQIVQFQGKYKPQRPWVRFWGAKIAAGSCTHLGPPQVMEVIIIDI